MQQAKNKRPLGKKQKMLILLLSAALALAILIGTLLGVLLTRPPVVMQFEGAVLREDVYRYWLACYKYEYLVLYKSLDIEDSMGGWSKRGEDGKTYDESFKAAIDQEIMRRFAAGALFDTFGLTLSESRYDTIQAFFTDLEKNSYGEKPYEMLDERYGIGKRVLKQIALYEMKYRALLVELYGSDGSGVYAAEYAEQLSDFYKENYYRYNVIYLSDGATAQRAEVEAEMAVGMTEDAFTALEKLYSEYAVTKGAYPNGIYLYGNASYTDVFSPPLLAAMKSLGAPGDITTARDEENKGTYYVMRYALDEAPYLSTDEKIKACFSDFAGYAAAAFYTEMLTERLKEITLTDTATNYHMASTLTCRDYNIVRMLGK